jgi:CRP/FNR family transcriptional regulator, cyclic AMP receptor protein
MSEIDVKDHREQLRARLAGMGLDKELASFLDAAVAAGDETQVASVLGELIDAQESLPRLLAKLVSQDSAIGNFEVDEVVVPAVPARQQSHSLLTTLDLVRRVPLFSMLTNDEAQAIASRVVKRRFRRGELVVEQGRDSNALFILLNGRARVLTSDSRGREVILAVLEAGDYVGEMSLVDSEPHSATVRCEIQTDILILGRDEFAHCLPDNSTLSYTILRGLVRRLRHADRQIESLALLDVYGRVARTLLEMAEDVNGVKMIRNKVSRQDMAKVVGASREMVSRVMKELEERGIVATQGNGSVVIINQVES